MFNVEKMGVADFSFAVKLANTMNWNMTTYDFEFMANLEPQGCFVLFRNQERFGIATSISFGKVGWFGNLIVKEDIRRKGAGSQLITHAIDYLKNKGVKTIGLYAYPHLVSFYERLGFKPDIDFSVLQGKSFFIAPQRRAIEGKKRGVPEIIDFDYQYFGANRRKLLEPILLTKENLCYISTENNEISGYVAAKVCEKIAEVGPLICHPNRVDVAILLLKTILNKLNDFKVFMYIPRNERVLSNMLHEAGFIENFRVVRMFLGPAIAKKCIYSAESLERG
jgi:predicted GNAT family acetyltransferase